VIIEIWVRLAGQNFGRETGKEDITWNAGVDGRIILKWI
jgi:hypothetical protein